MIISSIVIKILRRHYFNKIIKDLLDTRYAEESYECIILEEK